MEAVSYCCRTFVRPPDYDGGDGGFIILVWKEKRASSVKPSLTSFLSDQQKREEKIEEKRHWERTGSFGFG